MSKPLATRWWIYVWLGVPPLTYMGSAELASHYFGPQSWMAIASPAGLVALVLGTLFVIAWRQDLYHRRCESKTECPECGYSRSGLAPSAPCPECNHTIDPMDID